MKKYTFKVTVIPIKIVNEEDVLSEKEFDEVKEKKFYKGMKVLEIKDLGTDEFKKWMHLYIITTVSEGNGFFDCYYSDDIVVEKLKGVGAIVIRDKDEQPVRTMKTLVAKWYKKQVVYEGKAYEICNKFIT